MTSGVFARVGPRLTGPRQRKYIPVLATLSLLALMYGIGAARYEAFSDGQVFLNIFIDNAFLLVVAVGMTFVILTGGIDLSVGSVVALTTMISASLLERQGWSPYLVLPLVLFIGALLGFGMGCIIHYFEIQPFIVTLAGMFLARGLCYTISTSSIPISDKTWTSMAQSRIRFGAYFVSPSVVIALAVVVVAVIVLGYTRLGRNVYAIGGSRQSALLMGLPVGRTEVAVYTISGFCSALGGVLLSFYMLSGYGLHAVGLELDAIASVVIGGTLLTGGSGFVIGTVLGVLVLGVIQTLITFDGRLSSWWTRIVIGVLLLAFIVLQRVIGARRGGTTGGLARRLGMRGRRGAGGAAAGAVAGGAAAGGMPPAAGDGVTGGAVPAAGGAVPAAGGAVPAAGGAVDTGAPEAGGVPQAAGGAVAETGDVAAGGDAGPTGGEAGSAVAKA